MTQNEGYWDRLLRIVLGIGVLSLTLIGPRTAWGLVGLLPLLTGSLGYCPAYRLLGLDTCPTRAGSGTRRGA